MGEDPPHHLTGCLSTARLSHLAHTYSQSGCLWAQGFVGSLGGRTGHPSLLLHAWPRLEHPVAACVLSPQLPWSMPRYQLTTAPTPRTFCLHLQPPGAPCRHQRWSLLQANLSFVCAAQFKNRGGPGAKPLSDILEQCAERNVGRVVTEVVKKVLRSCWEQKDKRCSAQVLAAMIQRRLYL